MKKNYIIDTKTLLANPSCIDGFEDNIFIVTTATLQEINCKSNGTEEEMGNAKKICERLDELRQQGSLTEGVKTKNGGIVKVVPNISAGQYLPNGFTERTQDNQIIATCLYIAENSQRPTILVSNDLSMRVNASICAEKKHIDLGIESYRNTEVIDSGYTGHETIEISDPGLIDKLYKNGVTESPKEFIENEFITIKCGSQSAMSMYRNGELSLVKQKSLYGNIRPRNSMQTYAIEALTASPDDIPLVILSGPAGTAKTLLALANGVGETYGKQFGENGYYKMVLSRPNYISSDPGLGYLPGDLSEKMDPLIGPIYDNLQVILSQEENGREDQRNIQTYINDIFHSVIEVTALSYIRGRSLHYTYLMVDEAQNATRELIRDVITRAGEGTKVVLCGDPNQVDAVTLNEKNNGLVYAIETMKQSPLSAIIRFDKAQSTRSALAKEAIINM